MRVFPINRYRPIRASDGEGGWTETFAAPLLIYGAMRAHKTETVIACDFYEDVNVGDILGIEEDHLNEVFYRVTARNRILGAPDAALTVERTQRPITPYLIRFLLAPSGARILAPSSLPLRMVP